jgi:Yip1 domain
MSIVERVKNICLKPKSEWAVIAAETTSTSDLYKGFVVPLAAITPVASFVGGSIVGRSLPYVGSYRVPMGSGLALAIFQFVMALVSVFVLSLIIDGLAPTFGGEKNRAQALKVAAYSFTPAWVAGALQILPALGLLGVLAGLYGLYVLYLGLPVLMKCPQEKAVGYTVVVVLCAIVLAAVIGALGGTIVGTRTMMGGA